MKLIRQNICDTNILNKITQAYLFAQKKHAGQLRLTGEPYFIHLCAVTKILAQLNSESNTLIAGLLHDLLEDTQTTMEELTDLFGQDIAYLVYRATKLTKIAFHQNKGQTDNQQNMFLAMAKDIRVVIIKIADRLHNMQTLGIMPQEKQKRIAKETLEIYAPLTHRLGLFQIKSQLEDLSLRYILPEQYYRISNLIKLKKEQREKSVINIIQDIKSLFDKHQLKKAIIKGRIKNIYSIYKKINQRKVQFEEIFDLLAIRIIVHNVDLCYQSLGIIHGYFSPLPLRFKDYIAVPKPNLYQSLHTTVLTKDGSLFEIQIRTKEMDEIAEKGIAAHWAYKENKIYSQKDKQIEIAKKLRWYQELVKITNESQNHPEETSKDFVDAIKNDILSDNVYVFTPKQEVFELPKGSTPVDFAFRIHSEVGSKMIAAIVNGQIVPLDYQLKNGDIISIKTNKNILSINKDWLRIVKTTHAKRKIKTFLKKDQKEEDLLAIQKGKEIIEKEMALHKIELFLDQNLIQKHFERYNIKTLNEFYEEISKKQLNIKTVINKLLSLKGPNLSEILLKKQIFKSQNKLTHTNETGVIIEGLKNPQLKLASCCSPVWGDVIAGFLTKGRGIVVHREECLNFKQSEPTRMVIASWGNTVNFKYSVWINLIATTKNTLLQQVINKVNSLKISILEFNVINNQKLETIVKLRVLVIDIKELNNLMANLHKISNIYQIQRGNR
ncbi:bifunctional (p)ppGpp synthetase/guanosine-3',5'-bis(diphosphate) 3'-pyrophosphohydrolase ['Fragaria x ananassa' phyllody phytoplasma]|uniref:Bifunctional (P)ppGpp synthetase/guanosine-3',5'-bis(Diphosphate) 3'-pyrophosphohydrolase n=2 Tax='Fragaria x ananassa' phyllody phytoplasma TaxID=2358428 RepID=A0ABS5K2U0_9MOLU|nr:bifunctional (p)ppGpp synthetase/guanosine-3',5'-bis(diphosphate) 3'-pyrophosphohydrolase ['Fragaria x ananassa' phyllody phytoplasma]